MNKDTKVISCLPTLILLGLMLLVLPFRGFALGEFAGTYFGTFSGTDSGQFAMLVRADNTAVVSFYEQYDEEGLILSTLPINTDGSFSFMTGGDTVNGMLSDTGVSGTSTGPGTSITFSGTKAPAAGPLKDAGGYFSGTKLQGSVVCNGIPQGNVSGTVELIVAADGTAYMFGITYLNNSILGMEGGFLNVSAGGTISGTLLDTTQISGTVNLVTPGASGSLYFTDNVCTAQGTWSAARVDSLPAPFIPMPPAVTFLDPGWTESDFLSLGNPTRAIAFDDSDNLYIEDTSDDGSGTIEVLQLTPASGYTASTSYVSYPATYNTTTYKGATGLAFNRLGSLYVAERDAFGDAGIIREVDVATQTLTGVVSTFSNHRPTGVDADTSGNIYYSGRRESDGTWGRIFMIDPNMARTILIDNTVATGVALNKYGDVFISTPDRNDLPLQADSIYRFPANDPLHPELIATFNAHCGELTFDIKGNLYMIADDKVNIIKLSELPPKSMPWLPVLLD